ncbi:hypothetical protein [Lewinella sp. JB7]|uniref:hypothetical protein n=1 Tax=Lewinella sp. JB7 TaxID=2962887 RepID=UPI0020CA24E9|nr:hypothetical protein [Lewinella sp. JB7]MCP9237842.1 hypothetical protein [Lewinella sp. JB7]
MRFTLLFLLLLCFSVSVRAQMEASIDLVGGLDYTYRSLLTSSDESHISTILDNREKEYGKASWHVGLHYNRRLSEHVVLRSGLRLSSLGFGRESSDLRWGSQHTGTGTFEPDSALPQRLRASYNSWFVDVPIIGRREFGSGRWTHFVEIGLLPSVYIATQTGPHRFHLAGLVSVGAQYTVSETYHLFGQPVFRYHLTPTAEGPIREHLYGVGMEVGVRRSLR